MALDTIERINAENVAQDILIKALIYTLNQLYPNVGIEAALKGTIDSAVSGLNFTSASAEQAEAFRRATGVHAHVLVDGAFAAIKNGR